MSTAGTRLPSLLDDETAPKQGGPASPSGGRGSAGPSAINKETMKAAFAVVCLLAAVGFGVYQFTGGGPDLGSNSLYREVVDSKTNEAFTNFPIGENTSYPYTNPKTGERTLFPAERCYYTRDGKVKATPTLVFVKQYENENAGETMCPDCGRPVVRHNPAPAWSLIEEAMKREKK